MTNEITADMTRAEGTAKAFTVSGIESLINCARRQLAEIEALNEMFGDRGQAHRNESTVFWTQKLVNAEAAMKIRLARTAAA